MASAIDDLLTAFDRLSVDEQREVAAEVLRRTRDLDVPPIDEEAMCRIADETFLAYDAQEATDDQHEPG